MKKTPLHMVLTIGLFLVIVILGLAIIAFWMEQKAGDAPAGPPPAAVSVHVSSGTGPDAAPEAADMSVRGEAFLSGEAQTRVENNPDVEYDGVVRGPMTM